MSEALDEPRRLAYLAALGITQWVERSAVPIRTAAQCQAPAEPLPADPRPIEAAPPSTFRVVSTQTSSTSDGPAAMDWPELEAAVRDCRACALAGSRIQSVFGVGNRQAALMVIGEAPGADEDRAGEPFVGRAGRLLDLMLAAIGLPRPRVFIANILKCRPPGNRDPGPEEVLHCQGYLMRQIALVQPNVILSVGRISAQNLLRTDAPVGRLRGRWLAFGESSIPLRVTYHPAYLLRSPEQKAKAWEDLSEVARRLGAQ